MVTFAEPAVLVFSKQIEKATAGAVPRSFMYIVLGVGVAFGFGLGIASSVRGEPGMGFIFVQEVRRASGWLSEDLKSVT